MSRYHFRKRIKAFLTNDKPNASGELEPARTQSAPMIQAVAGPSIIGPLIKGGLNVLGEVLGDLGFPGASACNLVITAVEKYEEMKSNDDALNSLKKHCDHIAGVIADALKDRAKLTGPIGAALERLGGRLDVIVAPCEEAHKKHVFTRFLMSSENATKMQEIFDEVGRLIAAFVLEITLAGYFTVNKMYLAVENKVLSDNIDKLEYVKAAYNSNDALNAKRTVCLAGTRTTLLEGIGHWAAAPTAKPIYLLTGHAGFGKSTIVRTVAERLDGVHDLGASFFFSRDDSELKRNSFFFSTLARQLCLFDSAFAEAIGRALRLPEAQKAVESFPADQLRELLVKPLQPFNDTSRTVVIVVDALDECEDFESSEGDEWRRDVWDGLATLVEKLSFIRVFLTSRPHPHLTTLVKRNPHLYINNTSIEATDPDINRYLRYKLVEARKPQEWIAKDSEISALEVMVAGLFIVAATVVRFVLHQRRVKSPSDRIRELTSEGTISGPTNPDDKLGAVNTMYKKVLDLSLSLNNPDELQLFQTIVGSIIFLQRQFNLDDLAMFLGLDIAIIRSIIDKLQAIITLTDDTPQFHKSFVDYITDGARSDKQSIAQSQAHAFLAFRCFFAIGDAVDGFAIIYGARTIEVHCAAADPTILNRSLSDAQANIHPSFWIEVASCLKLKRTSDVIHAIHSTILDCMDSTSECNKEAVEILNLDIWTDDVLSEKTLRLILTSRTARPSYNYYALTIIQYLKTLLHHLSNDEMWQEDWILPSVHRVLNLYHRQLGVSSETTNAQILDLYLGNRGDGWAYSLFSKVYGTFEPADEARSILRQKLLESIPKSEDWLAKDEGAKGGRRRRRWR